MKLHVHKVALFASGGSHVTIYDAEVEIGGTGVRVIGTEPSGTVPGSYQEATEAIRRGAEQVLGPLGVGAIIRISRIILHPVDFNPRKFEMYTAEQLKSLMDLTEAPDENRSPPPNP
jgi:hypothetical protein